jgi:hypothetical protein
VETAKGNETGPLPVNVTLDTFSFTARGEDTVRNRGTWPEKPFKLVTVMFDIAVDGEGEETGRVRVRALAPIVTPGLVPCRTLMRPRKVDQQELQPGGLGGELAE